MTLKFNIHTISPSLATGDDSGGGGSPSYGVCRNNLLVPQMYIDFENTVKNDPRISTEFGDYLNTTYTKVYSLGFLYPDECSDFQVTQSRSGLIGVYFSDGTLIKADTSSINSFMPTHTYSENIEDVPEGYRYLILYYRATETYAFNDLSTMLDNILQNNINSWVANLEDTVEYMVLNMPFNNLGMSGLDNLCGFGITDNFSTKMQTNPVLPYGLRLRYMPSAAELFGEYTYTAIPQFRGSASTQAVYLPDLLDLSTIQEDADLNISNAYKIVGRIKLPAVNLDFDASTVFTYQSWKYMAENAPVVSGKTLTLNLSSQTGSNNLKAMGGADGAIYQTFISKGWTIV